MMVVDKITEHPVESVIGATVGLVAMGVFQIFTLGRVAKDLNAAYEVLNDEYEQLNEKYGDDDYPFEDDEEPAPAKTESKADDKTNNDEGPTPDRTKG